jgi:hypothetical protein
MLNNVWGALDNKDVPDPGYINFSIVVIEENAKLIGLAGGDMGPEEEPEGEEEALKKKNAYADLEEGGIPIELRNYQLDVQIYKGEFADLKGYTDKTAFKFKAIISQGNPQESAVLNGRNPAWKSEVKFPVKMPCYLDYIVIEVYSNE